MTSSPSFDDSLIQLDQTYRNINQLIQSSISTTTSPTTSPITSPTTNSPSTPRLSFEFLNDQLNLDYRLSTFTLNLSTHLSIQSNQQLSSINQLLSPTSTNSPSTSSQQQQQQHEPQQLCLTPTTHTSFETFNRSTRTMSLSLPPNQSNLRHRSTRPSLAIQPTPNSSSHPIHVLSAPANTLSINKQQQQQKQPPQQQQNSLKTLSSTTSHFTRSLLPSKSSSRPFPRSSKFSLATVNTNGLILVPSATGKPVAAPITNLSMLPLYLVQPFLSPNPSTATSNSTHNNNNNSQPNSPFLRLSQQTLTLNHLFTNRSSFPISPILPSAHHPHNHNQPFNQLINSLKQLLLFLAHPPKTHLIPPTEEKRNQKTHKDQNSPTSLLIRLMGAFNQRNNDQKKLLTQAEKTLILSDHYCCFAIPLYNTGIYTILAQFTIFGFVFGILSFSAPSILAIVLDFSFTAFFGVLCLTVGFIQALGFFGVYKEKPAIFKKYVIGNLVLLALTFAYSLVLLVISSTKHQTAIDQCLLQFVSNEEFADGPSNTSRQVCSIWTYAQLGICFFIWFLFFFSQLYFCYMVKVWGQDQKLDHIRYQSLISAVRQSRATSSIVNPNHPEGAGDEWESRSTGGSLDIRSSTYSSNGGQRAKPLANGGSRLKNEIEWKEIPSAVLDDSHHHLHPSAHPSPTSPDFRQKQKSKLSAQPQHSPSPGSSTLIPQPSSADHSPSNIPSDQLLANRDPAVNGHWIEVIDQPPRPSHQNLPGDDHEYYKS